MLNLVGYVSELATNCSKPPTLICRNASGSEETGIGLVQF